MKKAVPLNRLVRESWVVLWETWPGLAWLLVWASLDLNFSWKWQPTITGTETLALCSFFSSPEGE